MAKVPAHPRLADHNARVLRLARDYDKKFRPVVIPLGKHMNLETGDSFPRVQLIMRDSARYTDRRKPLSRSQVFKLLAEMDQAGALKTEPRFGPTGRQQSSIRYLDVHMAIRFGKPVEHLWDAPLPGDETPGETPGETPDETPITLSISLTNSPSNSVKTGEREASPSREIEREDRAKASVPAVGKSSGMCNTYTFWTVKGSGTWVYFRADKPPRQTPPKWATTVTLSPDEARFMWKHLHRNQHVSFLRASKTVRSNMMAHHDRPDARAEREADQAGKEAYERQQAAQRARYREERAPLVARYAELSGRDSDAIENAPLLRNTADERDQRVAVAWLRQKITKAEAK